MYLYIHTNINNAVHRQIVILTAAPYNYSTYFVNLKVLN